MFALILSVLALHPTSTVGATCKAIPYTHSVIWQYRPDPQKPGAVCAFAKLNEATKQWDVSSGSDSTSVSNREAATAWAAAHTYTQGN